MLSLSILIVAPDNFASVIGDKPDCTLIMSSGLLDSKRKISHPEECADVKLLHLRNHQTPDAVASIQSASDPPNLQLQHVGNQRPAFASRVASKGHAGVYCTSSDFAPTGDNRVPTLPGYVQMQHDVDDHATEIVVDDSSVRNTASRSMPPFEDENSSTHEEVKLDMHETEPAFDQSYMGSAPVRRLVHPTERSFVLSFIFSTILLITAVVVFIPVAVMFLLLLPIAMVIRNWCCCCSDGPCCSVPHHGDLIWLHESKMNCSILNALFTVQDGLNLQRIRELAYARIVAAQDSKGNRIYPRFSQRLHENRCTYCWINDDQFSIDNHVLQMPESVCSRQSLQKHLSAVSSEALPDHLPLWQLQIREEFGETKETLVFVRVHASLCDGVGLMKLLTRGVLDIAAQDARTMPQTTFFILLHVFRAFVVGPFVFLNKWLLTRKDVNVLHGARLSGE